MPLFQRTISHLECKHGLLHYQIHMNLILITKALGQIGGSFGERLHLLDRAVAIRELSVGRDKEGDAELLGLALEACASCCEEGGCLDEAEESWAKCVAASEKVSPFFESCHCGPAIRAEM